jgi:uncharacterized membrane protein
MSKREWMLKRNCSLSPRQLGLAYAVLLSMSVTVAGFFLMLYGMWQIFAFTVIEMTAVALAFLCYARHATDHEHVAFADNCLLVERVLAGNVHKIQLELRWIRIASPKSRQDLVNLEARGVSTEVGQFVTAATRQKFAQELRYELQRL